MTSLDAKFVETARNKSVEFEHGVNVVVFSATDATAGEGASQVTAELEVTMEEEVVGYITKYSDTEHGVVSPQDFGKTPPTTFHTLEGALEHLLPGVADGLADKPRL